MSAVQTTGEAEERAWDALAEVLDRLPAEALELIVSGHFDVREWAARELSSGRWRASSCLAEMPPRAELLTAIQRAD